MDDNLDQETPQTTSRSKSGMRRLGMVAAGIGLGSAVAYLLSRAFGAFVRSPEQDLRKQLSDNVVDDQGTGQAKAAKILRNLRDRAFEANDEKLALALGRPVEEVAAWNAGMEVIDDDVVMKARGIAMHRGVHIE